MNKTITNSAKFLLLVGILSYVLGSALFTYSFSIGPNYRNVSVDTTVNITDSLPTVLGVFIEGGAANITLIAGAAKNITCNATIRDYNGGSTITNVSATFYYNATSNDLAPDNNNTHYSAPNCTLGNFDNTTRNVSCYFDVWYYANSGRWICNVSVTDPFTGFNLTNVNREQSGSNRTNIDALLALNVTPLIDFGNMAVGDLSAAPVQANVTNLGNRNINISVRGYGNTSNDGLAMYCQVGNITVQNEKFGVQQTTDLSFYTNLSSTFQNISGLTVVQQTNASQQSINSTYWMLYVPPNPFGRCNGTIVFQAEVGG